MIAVCVGILPMQIHPIRYTNLNQSRNMIIEKQKSKRAVNKPVKILFPFRQIAIRTRTLHRLNPSEMMIRQGQ